VSIMFIFQCMEGWYGILNDANEDACMCVFVCVFVCVCVWVCVFVYLSLCVFVFFIAACSIT